MIKRNILIGLYTISLTTVAHTSYSLPEECKTMMPHACESGRERCWQSCDAYSGSDGDKCRFSCDTAADHCNSGVLPTS